MLETLGSYRVGIKVGILLRPEDIILSKESVKTSARNIVFAKIMDMVKADNMIDVYLKSGKTNIVSRITRSASEDLGIVIGDYVYAIFKASKPYLIREEYNERIF